MFLKIQARSWWTAV